MAILGFFAIIAGNNVPSLNLFGNLGTIPGEITYRTQIVIIFKYSGPSNTIPPFTAHPDLYYFQVPNRVSLRYLELDFSNTVDSQDQEQRYFGVRLHNITISKGPKVQIYI